jgi:hypothetical protein
VRRPFSEEIATVMDLIGFIEISVSLSTHVRSRPPEADSWDLFQLNCMWTKGES